MAEASSAELVTTRILAPDSYRSAGTVEELIARRALIEQVMDQMVEGTHYGKVPGTDKPALFKAGAEWLDNLFRFRTEFRREVEKDGEHRTVTTYTTLVHSPSGDVLVRDAVGVCSTRESKYAWRQAVRQCPSCGKDAIRKIRKEGAKNFGKWQCIGGDKGGCWAVFEADDPTVAGQNVGRIPNPDLADQWNTVYKMSEKRSHVGGTLTATAASDMFTQDEDAIPSRPDSAEATVEGETSPPAGNGAPRPAPKPTQRVAKPAQAPTEAKGAPAPMLNGIRKAAQRHRLPEAQIAGHYSGGRVQVLEGLAFEEGRTALAELQDAALGELAWAKAPEKTSDLPEALLPIVEHFQGDLEETALGVSGVLGREISTDDLKTLGTEDLGKVAEALLAH